MCNMRVVSFCAGCRTLLSVFGSLMSYEMFFMCKHRCAQATFIWAETLVSIHVPLVISTVRKTLLTEPAVESILFVMYCTDVHVIHAR